MASRFVFGSFVACVSLASSVVACSSSSSSPPKSELVLDYSADFTDLPAFYNAPYPSDLRLAANGTPDVHGFPNRDNAIVGPLVAIAQDRQGFPTVPTAFFQFTLPLGPRDPDTVIPAAQDSPVLLVDIDPSSDKLGTFYPTVAFTPESDIYTPDNMLSVAARPGIVLAPHTKYAFVVLTSLNDANGQRLGISKTMQDLMAGKTPDVPRGSDLAALYKPLVEAQAHAGFDLNSIAAATVFTTGDVVQDTFDLTTKILAAYKVQLEGLALRMDGDQMRNCELTGTVTYPQFQQGTPPFDKGGGTFMIGSDGLPVKQRDEVAPFSISIPKGTMPKGGFPLVAFFHGSGGLSTAVFDRGPITTPMGADVAHQGPAYVLAPHGIAAAGSAMPLNPQRFPGATETEYLNLNNLAAFRDTFRQGVTEQRLFIEALRTLTIDPKTLGTCAAGVTLPAGETAFHFNPDQLLGQGQSMGGMYTNMISAVEPRIKASVPTGAGGFWSYFILKTSVVPNAGGALGALLLGTRAKMTFMHPALAIGETAWEPAEPMVYMPRLARRPLMGHPTRPIYEPVGINDSYFPTDVYDAIVLAYGHKEAGDQQWTTMQDALKLENLDGVIPYPVSMDVTSLAGTPYTGVVVQYHEDNIDPDGHDIYKQLDAVKYQYGCFFETFLKTGKATVPAVAPLGTPCPM
jgi:hypothetical protein